MFFVAFYRRRKRIIEECELNKDKNASQKNPQKKSEGTDELRFDLVGGQENIDEQQTDNLPGQPANQNLTCDSQLNVEILTDEQTIEF